MNSYEIQFFKNVIDFENVSHRIDEFFLRILFVRNTGAVLVFHPTFYLCFCIILSARAFSRFRFNAFLS
jgi:hypothetical protein